MESNMNIESKDFNYYITPKDGKYTHVIIFLHGLGDRAQSYIDFFLSQKVLPSDIPIKIVLLQSPYKRVIFDMPIATSWFKISSFPLVSKECYNFNEAENSKKNIEKVIHEEAKLIGGKYENIYIGGFSQGGCLSLLVGLTFEHLLGGVICLSGYLFSEIEIKEDKKNLNIFVGHGEADDVITYLTSMEEMKRIENFKGFEKHSYPEKGHTITLEEIDQIRNFLSNRMKKE